MPGFEHCASSDRVRICRICGHDIGRGESSVVLSDCKVGCFSRSVDAVMRVVDGRH